MALCALVCCTPPSKVDKAAQSTQKVDTPRTAKITNSTLSEDDQVSVIAKIEDELITLGEFERRLNEQPPFARARYNSIVRKEDFLNNLVQFEVLAAEAKKRGLKEDPKVVLEMKQAMVRMLMADEIDSRMKSIKITEEELKAYYDEHVKDYVRPAKVRSSQIVVSDQAAADALLKELKSEFLKDPRHKRRIFALKAKAVSIDKPTADLGGDMRFYASQQDGGLVAKVLSEAVFALEHVGDMTTPIKSDSGVHILMLTAKKARYERTFDEVKANIRNRLYRERRTSVELDFVKEVKAQHKIEVNKENLAKIKDPEPPKNQPKAHGHESNIKPVGGGGEAKP